ncbi:MAG: pirin family protein [Bacteroidota bacterium]
MSYRPVVDLLPAHELDMGGTIVKQSLPTQKVERIDPFLLLHHFGPYEVAPGSDPLDVGPHPHRGFEPVTFLYSGGLRHRDSRGNTGYLQGGDVQWMTSGRGIIHSERASQEFLDTGGTMEGIQLWVNLPAAHKMVQPRYQDIKADQLQLLDFGPGVQARLVAGDFEDKQGPVATYSPLLIIQLELEAGAALNLPLPVDFNAGLYLLDGELQLNENFNYAGPYLINFGQTGSSIHLQGVAAKTRALLIAGAPIGEPVTNYGPFVMNTQTEIMEAMRDYQMGRMGFYTEY